MTGNGQQDEEANEMTEHEARKSQSRKFVLITAAIVAVAAVLTIASVMATAGGGDAEPSGRQAVAGVVESPVSTADAQPSATASSIATTPAVTVTATATAQPTLSAAPATAAVLTPTATAGPTPPPTASSASATPTLDAGGVTITPAPATPTPSGTLTLLVQAQIASTEQTYGVRILTDGQDWGADETTQLRNISAVQAALAGVPTNVRVAIAANGALTFLSNHAGRTEGGWTPYGEREANYFSNEDVTSAGHVKANQIVLQPGSTSQTIAHEIMHAYQMRDIGPGEYVLALLTPEMKSFMQATGWTQTATDDEIRAAAAGGWDAVDGLFEYHGHLLNYTNEFGDDVSLFAPNPLEAYAEAGGLYYGHSSQTTLPDWSDYWTWFATNVG